MVFLRFAILKLKDHYLLLLILILASILLSINLNKPFIGHHDWNGAFWGSQARRYLNYFSLYSKEQDIKFNQIFFSNYTPLLPLIFTLSALIFGLSEFSMRVVPLVFSLIMIIFIYKIGKAIYSKSVGLLAAVFAIVTPMFIYFGKLPDHEPIVVSLITITFYFYLTSAKQKKLLRIFLFFLTVSLLESWPAFFLVPPFVLFSIFIRREKISRAFWPVVVSIIVIGFQLSLIYITNGQESIRSFIDQGLFRLGKSNLQIGLDHLNFDKFLITEARFAVIYYTRILLMLSILWGIYLFWRMRSKIMTKKELHLIILLIYPVLFILTFKQLAYIHDYKLYHFLPFVTLSASSIFILSFKYIKILFGKVLHYGRISSFLEIMIIFALVLFIGVERIKFLKTLLNTSFNMPGYEVGIIINSKTQPKDKILINSPQFKSFYEVFVDYYGDRKIEYENVSFNKFVDMELKYRDFNYLVLIDEREIDPQLALYLPKNYYSERIGPYSIFNLKKTLN